MAPLPGHNENISTASICGYNIGINRLLKKKKKYERLEAGIKVLKYLTSKEMQKKYFLNGDLVTAIPSLYDDEEVCKVKDCKLYKSLQPLLKPPYGFVNKYEYEKRFGKLAASYLYENKDLTSILNDIEDISKIYFISLNSDDYYIGLITLIIICVISVLMVLSLIYVFLENFNPFFKNFSVDSWILLIIGLVITLCSSLANIGMVTTKKCNLRLILFSVGISIYLLIILYELSINFPKQNKYSEWIKKHKYIFLLLLFLIDFTFNGLSLIKPYSVSTIIEDKHNFQICEFIGIFGKLMFIIIIINKIIILLTISFLIFSEWNLTKTYYEVRFILSALYSSLLIAFISLLFDFIQINNYYLQFILQNCIIIFFSLSNYIFLYGYKLLLAFMKKQNIKLKFISNINKNFIEDNSCYKTQKEEESQVVKTVTIIATATDNDVAESCNNTEFHNENVIQKPSFFTKILNYHYSTEINSDDIQYSDENANNSISADITE